MPILFAVWSPSTSKAAGFWGMLAGAVGALFWYALGYMQFNSFANWPFGIWPGIFGTVVSMITILVVSKFTEPIDQETKDIFYVE